MDRRFGARLRDGGIGATRRLRPCSGFLQPDRASCSRQFQPGTFSLLSSHGGERPAMALTMVIIAAGLGAGVMFSVSTRMQDPASLGQLLDVPGFLRWLAHDRRRPLRRPARSRARRRHAFHPAPRSSSVHTCAWSFPTSRTATRIALRRSCPAASRLGAGDARATAAARLPAARACGHASTASRCHRCNTNSAATPAPIAPHWWR